MPKLHPRLNHVLVGRDSGVYAMAYREWGDPANPEVVICAHGLTRNGRDFAYLADELARDFRVVAPDVVGRGDSESLRDPMGYQIPLYVQDMLVLIARLNVPQVAWLGTSMGGLIGLLLAAMPGTPIKRLLLNDVGPTLPAVALARIGDYLGSTPPLPNRQTAEAYIRAISAPFGPHSDAQWSYLTEVMLRPDGDGWRLNYDPKIALPFKAAASAGDVDLWPYYDQIRCPVLLTRGELSDLLRAETALSMTERGPKASLTTFAGVGHAPTFLVADQIATATAFFSAGKASGRS